MHLDFLGKAPIAWREKEEGSRVCRAAPLLPLTLVGPPSETHLPF